MRKSIKKHIEDKIQGGIIGFMIGDAMGLPIAGMRKSDVLRHVGIVKKYINNFRHPFAYFLKEGQYGSNSRLLISSLQSLVKNGKYNRLDLKRRLTQIARKSKADFFYSRWIGETITKTLLSGEASFSNSCTCIYYSIPLSFFINDLNELAKIVEENSKLTHISPISLAASTFVTRLLFHLKGGKKNAQLYIEEAAQFAGKKYKGSEKLIENILLASNKNKIKNVEIARKVFGTGSLAYQTIPLSIYIFLNNMNNFENAIIAGVNSYRDDQEEEKKLRYVSYPEELIHCRGGATDGIASLVGSFIGCYIGYSQIPKKFLSDLEDRNKVQRLISSFFHD